MVLLKASGALGVVALSAGMLVAAPAAAGTGAGAAFGLSSSVGVAAMAAQKCVGAAPTYADVMVRPAWTERIEHEATWVTQALYTRWVVDQEYRPAVPEVAHDEFEWSAEPLAGWTATGESRRVLVRPGAPAVPEVPAVTEERLVHPGQPYVPPTVELIRHDAQWTTVHHEAVYETVHHPAVYETIHHDAVIQYEFRQKNGNITRWETDPDWNAQGNPNSIGWEATGVSEVVKEAWDEEKLVTAAWDEEVLVSPARDEQVLVKDAWVEEVVIDPGQEEIPPTYETVVVTPYQPAVPEVPEEWGVELEYTRRVITQEALPEVPEAGHAEEVWSAESPGEGWEATGETRQVEDRPAWTDEIAQPAVFENQMVHPGVVCPAVAVSSTAAAAATPAKAATASLPSTGVGEGLLPVAGLAVAAGTALLAFRAWVARIADGRGRHRGGVSRGALASTTGELTRWRPFRRRAHRRTA
ncbi:hypothetical protein ATJ97_2657 [Georgenia soli]|uniref:Uncharacterized protein n=1 Tax=Georgenia soli TaxID=638953 RepID=A0A2A9ENG0_9MICO|nr:hypothetical protein [Georgenia soli]PFG40136.1 hypothetical protein ATJ97_2657 [Georgenia soli]